MSEKLLTDDELRAIEASVPHCVTQEECLEMLADLHRYRDWCRRLVAWNGDQIEMVQLMTDMRAAMGDE